MRFSRLVVREASGLIISELSSCRKGGPHIIISLSKGGVLKELKGRPRFKFTDTYGVLPNDVVLDIKQVRQLISSLLVWVQQE